MSNLLRPCGLRSVSAFQSTSHPPHATSLPPTPSTSAPVTPFGHKAAPCDGSLPMDRRDVLVLGSSLVMCQLQQLLAAAPPARANDNAPASTSGRGFSKYIKKKQLDPLDTYVPAVLEARQQLQLSQEIAVSNPVAARDLLRQGAFSGLRDNIRALGEYAVMNGQEKESSLLVTNFFRSLEDYDGLLWGSIRSKTDVMQTDVDSRVQSTVTALDQLVATVPKDIVARARNVLEVTAAKATQAAQEGASVDQLQLQQLIQ